MSQFKRVLIANRGEIAIRIARAAAALGMESIAVFAPVDKQALHTRIATEAHELPAASNSTSTENALHASARVAHEVPAASESIRSEQMVHASGRGIDRESSATNDPIQAYLNAEALIAIARQTGCDCVHPGYGFLAESARFAELCAANGVAFVGPSPESLTLFGDKVRARALAGSLNVPVVPSHGGALSTPEAARRAADELGYPVMLKAAAGGGGRGMRMVASPEELPAAFERCQSEAGAAFGDRTLFVEKLIPNPRHIEVQILGDDQGQVVHLFERDCSVQLRNQKLIETAPAPNLDKEIRARLHSDAVRLAQAANYTNAGTVEFLVAPESNDYYFIECNPRIQVEHTVTEQITGIDLVEAQFQIAAGVSLDNLGLVDHSTIRQRPGYAIQARVTASGVGTISAYKEPSGPGVRVDAAGYLGYAPPPQFDPLLAKVICTSTGASFAAAVHRARRALDEFHIEGLDTNLPLLRALLDHPDFCRGDARTTLITANPKLSTTATNNTPNSTLALLHKQAAGLTSELAIRGLPRDAVHVGVSSAVNPTSAVTRNAGTRGVNQGFGAHAGPANAQSPPVELAVPDGDTPVPCPMSGTVVAVGVREGDAVIADKTLLIISAMKMESEVAAPCSGTLSAALDLHPGDNVLAGQVVMAITPDEDNLANVAAATGESTWAHLLDEVAAIKRLALKRLQPGSQDPGVVRQRSRGKLTCRERIDLLLDEGSFQEVGSVTGFPSYDQYGNIAAFTPSNHVGGWGRIDGRPAVVCADDFTSRGGHSDGAIGAKSTHLDRLSLEMRMPSIRLLDGSSGGGSVASMVPQQKRAGESRARESEGAIKAGRPRVAGTGGSFLPGHLGGTMFAEQLATVPVVNMLLGSVVGLGAAKAVLGHFSVMVRDIAQLFVAGPPVVSHAMGYDISKEELGGWHIHCTNGAVDNPADTEEEAAAMTRRFLSYLPNCTYEPPPVMPADPDDPPDRREEALFTLVPRKRTSTFDIRRAIKLMADKGSFFEIGPLWGTDQVTGFIRMNGIPMGVVASDSQHANGGALTADGCRKVTRHLDLCDLFHLPILNLVDNPGFAVGLEHEIAGTIRRGGEWMIAFAQVAVPIFTVIVRRSFGVAGNNFATPRSRPSMRIAWPAADVGGIPPEGGIEAAYKRQLAEAQDPQALRDELMARIESARGPIGPLSKFQMEEMIDPRDTRKLICEWAQIAYRIATQPTRLKPRAIQFRP